MAEDESITSKANELKKAISDPEKHGARLDKINRLPPELLLTILDFFSPQELQRLADVSGEWSQATKHKSLWKKFLKPYEILTNDQKVLYKSYATLKKSFFCRAITPKAPLLGCRYARKKTPT